MTDKKHGFVKVDDLMPQLQWQQACDFYGVDPGPVHEGQKEVRTACFFNCGKTEPTGNRAIAIDTSSPFKLWRCHQYGCGKGGNLVGMCDLMKAGANCDGKPKGPRFKEVAADVRAMVEGISFARGTNASQPAVETESVAKPLVNLPLKDHPKEVVRALTTLDEKFLVVPDETMNKDAAAYQRRHPCLTPELCKAERCGYLPRPGSSGDRRGGSLQGTWAYCWADENGEPISWFGRTLQYEELHTKWVAGGREGTEPQKFRFVKGFHRGAEVLGQHEWNDEAVQKRIRDEVGALIVVEGPNDRLGLKSIGVDAFAICSNVITPVQAEKISSKAREIGVPVGLMFDNDSFGEKGVNQSLPKFAEYGPVQLLWSPSMHDGQFKGWQPEQLIGKPEKWATIRKHITDGS